MDVVRSYGSVNGAKSLTPCYHNGFASVCGATCVMNVNHHRAYLPSERRSVTLFRALVVGKTTEMYCELFQSYFRAAKEAGLRSPADDASTTAAQAAAHETTAVTPGRPKRGAQFSAVLLDFELAEHNGLFKALANVFGDIPLRYHGRVVGCRVHLQRFLLPKCGNDYNDPFFVNLMRLRDVDSVVGVTRVMQKLHEMYELYDGEEGGGSKANCLKWMLDNRSIVVAAFPFCSGQLSRDAIRATGESTNAIESLNKQTQDVVAADGDRSLLGVISSLWEFDKQTLAELSQTNMSGRTAPAVSTSAAKVRQLTRQRKRNSVPDGGQPPGKRRSRVQRNLATPPSLPPATASSIPPSVNPRLSERPPVSLEPCSDLATGGEQATAASTQNLAAEPMLYGQAPQLLGFAHPPATTARVHPPPFSMPPPWPVTASPPPWLLAGWSQPSQVGTGSAGPLSTAQPFSGPVDRGVGRGAGTSRDRG